MWATNEELVKDDFYRAVVASRRTPKRYDGGQVRAYCDALQAEKQRTAEESKYWKESHAIEKMRSATEAAAGKAGGLANLIVMLESSDSGAAELAARALKVQSSHTELHSTLARAGVVAALVRLLARGTTSTMERIAGQAIWNLATNADNKVEIAHEGGIPPLVRMISGSPECQEIACGALGSLAFCEGNKLAILRAGALAPLREVLEEGETLARQLASAALRELCSSTEVMDEVLHDADAPASPILRRAIAGDTILDDVVVGIGRTAANFFAPQVDLQRLLDELYMDDDEAYIARLNRKLETRRYMVHRFGHH